MKKLLLMSGLVSLAAVATAGHFDTMYTGLKLDYAWSKLEYEDKKTSAAGGNFQTNTNNLNGFEMDALFGQGFQMDDNWNYGFEGQIGHGLSEAKKSWERVGTSASNLQIKNRRLWKFGAAGRFGRTFSNALVYARLGLHANQYESKVSISNNAAPGAELGKNSTRFFSWAVAPGAGVEWSFTPGVNARLEYVYEYSFTQKDITVAGKKFDINEPRTHVLSVGVTFAI